MKRTFLDLLFPARLLLKLVSLERGRNDLSNDVTSICLWYCTRGPWKLSDLASAFLARKFLRYYCDYYLIAIGNREMPTYNSPLIFPEHNACYFLESTCSTAEKNWCSKDTIELNWICMGRVGGCMCIRIYKMIRWVMVYTYNSGSNSFGGFDWLSKVII